MTMIMKNLHWIMKTLWITLVLANHFCNACTFYSTTKDYPSSDTESGKFIRIKEDHAIGDEIIMFDVYPRKSIELRAIDRSSDDKYFRIREINSSTIAIHLERSLDELVDNDTPQNILKFKIQCNSMISNSNSKNHDISYLMMTVYVEDINDNKPVFLNTPYSISIDETIPFGSVVFQGIQAIDRDKPNTPNSDIQYFIGQQTVDSQGAFFMLDSPHRPHVILKRSLDFDNGIRQFDLNIIARDRGVPPQQTNTTMTVFVDDIDDLPPMFTQDVYFTKIKEFFTITGKGIHKALKIEPPIEAYDQDSINSTLVYSILSGNDKNTFWIHPTTGTLFLKKEIDLESENLAENTYNIQIDVRQKNDPMKRAMARIEIEIVDINDNLPEFEVDLYNISIVENLPNGFSVLQVNALDRDQGENSMFFYKVFQEEPQGAFSVDPVTGWMTVKNQSLLDREERASVRLLIQAVEKMKPYNKRDPTEDATVAVEITLLDANDNTPVFDMGNLYEFKVDMNASIGHQVGLIHADDPDDGKNGEIMYDMKNRKETTVPFNLNSKTGILTVTGKMLAGRIALFVEACDQPINPSEQRCSLAVLTLDIVNMSDDTEIKFMGAPYEFWISSSAPIGSSVGQVRTVYRDDIIYDLLHSYSEGVPFAIEEQSGIITVIRPINSFNRNLYSFEAVATYAHLPVEHAKNQSRSSRKTLSEDLGFQVDEGIVSDLNFASMFIANVTVNIVNPSSKNTVFVKGPKNQLIEFHVQENQADAVIGSLLIKNITDMSKGLAGSPSTTQIKVQRRPAASSRENRQLMTSSKFRKASDGRKNVTATVTTPATLGQIPRKSRTVIYEKNTTIRKNIHRVVNLPPITLFKNISNEKPLSNYGKYMRAKNRVSRAATPKNLSFFIVNDYDLKDKIYVSNDGKLMTLNGLDREEKDFYKLSVIAEYSNGLIESAGIYQINVIVDDENDNPPKFQHSSYIGIISENCQLGTEVMLNNIMFVSDPDVGKNSEFQLSIMGDGNRLFTIEKSLERRKQESMFHNFNNSALSTFSDTVLDEYSSMVDVNLHLMMMSSQDTTLNQSHYVVKFSGPSILDRERKNFYKLRLLAKDSGGLTSEAQLMIFVTDVNDNAPVFEKISVFKQTGIEILQYTDKMEMLFIDAIESNTVAEKIVQTTPSNRFNIREKFEPPLVLKSPVKIRYRKKNPIGSPRFLDDDEDGEMMTQGEDRSFKIDTPEIIRNLSAKYPLFSIEESLTPGVTILQLTATDDDYGPNSRITYEISNEIVETMSSFKGNLSQYSHTTVPFFSIDRMSGELKINRQLLPNVEIQVNITAKDAAGLVDTVTIGIRISDVNNHPPQFLRPFYSFDIEEGFHISKILGTVQALDDDFEDNANITYTVDNADNGKFPFSVTAKTGILKVSGMLDRELKSLYEFRIMAKDNSRKYNQLNATVAIEINIIDQNDNSPQFIGYDDLMIHEIPSQGRKMNSDVHKHDDDLLHQNKTPVYKASLDRHSSGRRLIKQIHAIDIDYALNGMVFYGFLHNNISHLFEIDAREGVVTTTPDEEQLKLLHKYDLINLTIVASDLGNPVRSSRALLLINLEGEKIVHPPKSEAIRITSSTSTFTSTTTTTTKAPEHKVLFVNQYYELEVVENNPIPMKLIQFNTTNNIDTYKWSMVFENHNGSTLDVTEYFNVADGVLWLMKSLDREELDFYQLRIKAEVQRTKRRGKSLQMMYPVTDDRINNLANNEVRVMVKVLDQNDHSPLFRENGPIIAVIPDTVTYGYNVLRVEAEDDDTGLNAEIRYSIFNDVTNFFGIDALTGQIRTLGPLWRSNQKVYGFDVKATDRQGDEKGNSNIVNVLVYVLDENKHVKFVMSGNTMEIEKEAETIARSLSDASGLIVKIRMLEPHEINMEFMTNVYIYAIDPKTNTVVEMEELQGIMEQLNMHEIQPSLPIIELIKYGVPAHLSPKVHQGTGKLASIVLSITILVGGLATACCIICVRYKRRRMQNSIAPVVHRQMPVNQQIIRQHLFLPQPSGDSSTDPVSDETCSSGLYAPVLKQLIPNRKNNYLLSRDDTREYIDIPLPKSVMAINLQNHENNCARYNYMLPSKNNILKHHYESNECICQSDEHNGDELVSNSTNNSYDDSLKEFETTTTTRTETTIALAAHQRTSFRQKILDNLDRHLSRHSFSGFHVEKHLKNSRRSSFMLHKTGNNPLGRH